MAHYIGLKRKHVTTIGEIMESFKCSKSYSKVKINDVLKLSHEICDTNFDTLRFEKLYKKATQRSRKSLIRRLKNWCVLPLKNGNQFGMAGVRIIDDLTISVVGRLYCFDDVLNKLLSTNNVICCVCDSTIFSNNGFECTTMSAMNIGKTKDLYYCESLCADCTTKIGNKKFMLIDKFKINTNWDYQKSYKSNEDFLNKILIALSEKDK